MFVTSAKYRMTPMEDFVLIVGTARRLTTMKETRENPYLKCTMTVKLTSFFFGLLIKNSSR